MLDRFLAKLGANVVNLLASIVRLTLVARVLGPEGYGRFEFLYNFFQQLASFLDMGTSTCLYTKLSQRQTDRGLVRFYAFFVFGVSALLLVGVALLVQLPVGEQIWAGESWLYVLLAAVLGCLTWWRQVVSKVVDAYGLTVRGELWGIAHTTVMLGALVLLVFGGWLSFVTYLVFQIASFFFAIVVWALLLKVSLHERPMRSTGATLRQYAAEFWHYSHPLVVYSLVGVVTGLFERWLLQTQSGSVQQGFYGLAYQIGAVCFLFTSAMTQLLTRDFAIAWARDDRAAVAQMFSRYIPVFYVIASFLSVFVAFRAPDIVQLVGGSEFAAGTAAVAIMALYPMHQTYGQLSGSIYYATDQTRLYRNIGVLNMVIGVPLTYWLIAPAAQGGWDLGASGLAIKMVLMQAVFVNISLWFNTRLLRISFGRLLIHQITVPLVFFLCSWIGATAQELLRLSALPGFLLSGIVYSLLALAAVMSFPRLFGIHKEDLRKVQNKVVAVIRRRPR